MSSSQQLQTEQRNELIAGILDAHGLVDTLTIDPDALFTRLIDSCKQSDAKHPDNTISMQDKLSELVSFLSEENDYEVAEPGARIRLVQKLLKELGPAILLHEKAQQVDAHKGVDSFLSRHERHCIKGSPSPFRTQPAENSVPTPDISTTRYTCR